MKLVVDTNCFLRYITNDIPDQASKIEKWFLKAESGEVEIQVLDITIVEILYQLENWYHLSKIEATQKCINLISPIWINISNKSLLIQALVLYPKSNVDFVDLLTWAFADQTEAKILSFDRDFDKLTPKLRLNP